MSRFTCEVVALVALALTPLLAAEEVDGEWYARIKLGGLRLGLAEAGVIGVLGQPAAKGAQVEEAATGLFVTEWAWPAQGIRITLGAETRKGAQVVDRLQLTAPCKLKTPEGIGIGSTAAAVLAAYKSQLDPETPPTERTIVVGSLFGGMIFTLENGLVTAIFVGAAAE
jgi:hypothetical protein